MAAPERYTNVIMAILQLQHVQALQRFTPAKSSRATDKNTHLHAHTHFHATTGPHFHAQPMKGDWDGEPSRRRPAHTMTAQCGCVLCDLNLAPSLLHTHDSTAAVPTKTSPRPPVHTFLPPRPGRACARPSQNCAFCGRLAFCRHRLRNNLTQYAREKARKRTAAAPPRQLCNNGFLFHGWV